MAGITVYQKPTCSKCREVHKILEEKGIAFESVNYYLKPLSKEKLSALVEKMAVPASSLLRTKESVYRELKIAEQDLSDEAIIELMTVHPDLMQRPIVEKGDKAVLARPVERIKEIL